MFKIMHIKKIIYGSAILALFSITKVEIVLLPCTNNAYVWKAMLYLYMHPVWHRNKIWSNVFIPQQEFFFMMLLNSFGEKNLHISYRVIS